MTLSWPFRADELGNICDTLHVLTECKNVTCKVTPQHDGDIHISKVSMKYEF